MITVFADEAQQAVTSAGAQTGAAGGVGAMIASLLPLVLVFAVMYFILIAPQKKKEKALRKQLEAMKVGDKVVTIGGISGKISRIKDDFVIIETGNVGTPTERSFIKFEKSAIKSVEQKISN